MRRWLFLLSLACGALFLFPVAWKVQAQATDTPTPTATDTPTATSTATATSTTTATPALVITDVTSNNQGFEVRRYINAGDVAYVVIWLIAIGLMAAAIVLALRSSK